MQPEISRRCRSCGAAVRAGARFCPQCGVLVEAEAAQASNDAGARSDAARSVVDGDEGAARAESGTRERAESIPRGPAESGVAETRGAETHETASPREWTPPTKEFSAFVDALEVGGAREGLEARDGSAAEAQGAFAQKPPGGDAGAAPSHVAVDVPRVAADAGAAEEVASAETRGRGARMREGARARVGKMREEALVVLEETPDDSGLRFVIAAAALFLVFLFILFLSTTVLR
jgi:hypothetical protein